MKSTDRQQHWDQIYQTKALELVGWYQPIPETSLSFFEKFAVPTTARIIDIGGGDSLLVDHLLDRGYRNVTVLDVSATAIERARRRLGDRADRVTWIVTDVTDFDPTARYDFWHDRAAFHFLLEEAEITRYLRTARRSLVPGGILLIGTFSKAGPTRCSGIDIQQYSEQSMTALLEPGFEKVECITVDHRTPAGTAQNFIFCSFTSREPERIQGRGE